MLRSYFPRLCPLLSHFAKQTTLQKINSQKNKSKKWNPLQGDESTQYDCIKMHSLLSSFFLYTFRKKRVEKADAPPKHRLFFAPCLDDSFFASFFFFCYSLRLLWAIQKSK